MTVHSMARPRTGTGSTVDSQHPRGYEQRRNAGAEQARDTDEVRETDGASGNGPVRDRLDGSVVAQLLSSAAHGDHSAWNALVERFAPTVWAIARGHRLNSADAADVFQTTWLRLLEHLDRIEHPERVGAWLATTARRESLRVIRLAGRQVPNGEDLEMLPDPTTSRSPDAGLVAAERKQIMDQLLQQLPKRSRLLLQMLSADSPPSYKEISTELAMPIGSIGPTRARALEQLHRLAASTGVDLEAVYFA